VKSFIDNIIVGMEEEEGHNKIMEKVVKRLVENDLYVKLEKYKWKIKEIIRHSSHLVIQDLLVGFQKSKQVICVLFKYIEHNNFWF